MTFGISSISIIELISLIYFVLISCYSMYIFFTWNLSGKFGSIHCFTMAPNKMANWSLFFLRRSWNARVINKWIWSLLLTMIYFWQIYSPACVHQVMSKNSSLNIFSKYFILNQSINTSTTSMPQVILKEGCTADRPLAKIALSLFCSFMLSHGSHSLSCWGSFEYYKKMLTSIHYAGILLMKWY